MSRVYLQQGGRHHAHVLRGNFGVSQGGEFAALLKNIEGRRHIDGRAAGVGRQGLNGCGIFREAR